MSNEGMGRGEGEERRVGAAIFSDLVYVVFELIANYMSAWTLLVFLINRCDNF